MWASSASVLTRRLLGLFYLEAFVRLRCSMNPLVLTPNSSHISAIGQATVFMAIQAYFTGIPLQSTRSPGNAPLEHFSFRVTFF